MKKTVLVVLTGLFICGYSFAQQSIRNGAIHKAPVRVNDLLSAERNNAQADIIPSNAASNARTGAAAVVIGNSANPFTGVGVRSAFQYVPELNTLMLMHRQDPTITGVGESGWIRYAISTDGGANWTQDEGPLWDNTAGTNARYPQGFIVNPAGNTDPNNAHAVFMGPTLEGTNGTSWGGVGYGSRLIGGTGASTNQILYNSSATGRLHYIPDGGTVVNNNIWVIDPVPNWISGTGVYTDTLAIYKGVINGGQVDFSEERVYFPVHQDGGFPTSEAIAFSPDGQTGYITMLGRLDSIINPNETYSVIWLKTTDGGTTWSAPATFDISNDPVLLNQLGGDSTFLVTTAFEQDVAVDKNGNPHVFLNIGLADAVDPGFALFGASSMMYHMWSPDGGVSWNIDSIGGTHTFRGYWGDITNDITEDNRPQIARDTSGSYIMMAYFDNDTTLLYTPCQTGNPPGNVPCGNIDRTIKYAGFNVDKDFHSETITDLNGLDALQMSFEFIPDIAMDNGMGIEIPLTYQLMSDRTNYVSPTTHKYQSGIMLTYEQLGDTLTSLEEVAFESNIAVFPNPVAGELNITFNAERNGDVQIEIFDMIGRRVYINRENAVSGLTNRHTVNTASFDEGMYILKINQDGEYSTRKFLKN